VLWVEPLVLSRVCTVDGGPVVADEVLGSDVGGGAVGVVRAVDGGLVSTPAHDGVVGAARHRSAAISRARPAGAAFWALRTASSAAFWSPRAAYAMAAAR
jgi:hypothetical protein